MLLETNDILKSMTVPLTGALVLAGAILASCLIDHWFMRTKRR